MGGGAVTGGDVAGGAVTGGAVDAGEGVGEGAGAMVPPVPGVIEWAVTGGDVGAEVEGGGLVVVVAADGAAAAAGTANHTPATPWPMVSPAFLSPLNR